VILIILTLRTGVVSIFGIEIERKKRPDIFLAYLCVLSLVATASVFFLLKKILQ
jgi:hypothetical protein